MIPLINPYVSSHEQHLAVESFAPRSPKSSSPLASTSHTPDFPTNYWKNPRTPNLPSPKLCYCTLLLILPLSLSSKPAPFANSPLLWMKTIFYQSLNCVTVLLLLLFLIYLFKPLTNSSNSASEIVLLPLSHISEKYLGWHFLFQVKREWMRISFPRRFKWWVNSTALSPLMKSFWLFGRP